MVVMATSEARGSGSGRIACLGKRSYELSDYNIKKRLMNIIEKQ